LITLVDYYSYTIPTDRKFGEGMFESDNLFAIELFTKSADCTQDFDRTSEHWEAQNAKGFYATRLRHTISSLALSYGNTNRHVFVELVGQSCANFDALDKLLPLIASTFERCSRIDFAVDIKTEISPKDFIDQRGNKSFKSSGHHYSPSGRTEYLGGRTSERMARIYRYEPPHPRNEYLRVEVELKGDAAKAYSKYLTTHTVEETTLAAHQAFKWQHAVWDASATNSDRVSFRSYRPENAATVHWLYGDVITALRKAVSAGLVDFEEWLKIVREGLKDDI